MGEWVGGMEGLWGNGWGREAPDRGEGAGNHGAPPPGGLPLPLPLPLEGPASAPPRPPRRPAPAPAPRAAAVRARAKRCARGAVSAVAAKVVRLMMA